MILKGASKITSGMKIKKILVICASGIGNTILFTPTLRGLRKGLPKAKVTLLVTKSVFAEPIKGSKLANQIVVFENGNSLWKKIKLIHKLRKEKFDYSLTAFPSNRWQFNVLAFLVGAQKRITHNYKVGKIRTLSFLQNVRVSVDEKLHDIEQNLNLLKPIKITPSQEKKLLFYLSPKEKKLAGKFWQENNLDASFVVGIHPGSGGIQQEAKRWPEEKFAEFCNRLIKEKKVKILIFGGPEEKKLKEKIKSSSKNKGSIYLVNASLKQVAALIKRCNLFISNDSGLMNMSIAVGVKTIGIFGPTNYKRTAPYGRNGYALRRKNLPCSPCLKYPFYSTSSKVECEKNFECLRKIRVKDIINIINENLNRYPGL